MKTRRSYWLAAVGVAILLTVMHIVQMAFGGIGATWVEVPPSEPGLMEQFDLVISTTGYTLLIALPSCWLLMCMLWFFKIGNGFPRKQIDRTKRTR